MADTTAKSPFYSRWTEDERRQRASFLATRRSLAPFLVAHRFEGDKDGANLLRARYGYGVRLNSAYLNDIMGHIRGVDVDRDGIKIPEAEWNRITSDFTGLGESWDDFFSTTVLEWTLSSLGGLIVVDTPPEGDNADGERRAYGTFVPMSSVLDVGRSRWGFRWVVIQEDADTRKPGERSARAEAEKNTLLYELDPQSGQTLVTRKDADGKQVGSVVELPKIVTLEGRPTLPIVLSRFGKNPDISWLGTGLLYGLDDIVIDLFNVYSETREAFRDAAFSILAYTGPDGEEVKSQIQQGSRVVELGNADGVDVKITLERIAADSGEVASGLAMIAEGVAQWREAAKRRSSDAASGTRDMSGIALQAEFQLDLKPMLVQITEQLNQTERRVAAIVSQMHSVSSIDTITIVRNTDFRLEDEAARIARIAEEFLASGLQLPGVVVQLLTEKWAESADIGDLDEPIKTADGGEKKLRDVLTTQIAAIADAAQQRGENTGGGAFVEPEPEEEEED